MNTEEPVTSVNNSCSWLISEHLNEKYNTRSVTNKVTKTFLLDIFVLNSLKIPTNMDHYKILQI
jgi:hypothetical protein